MSLHFLLDILRHVSISKLYLFLLSVFMAKTATDSAHLKWGGVQVGGGGRQEKKKNFQLKKIEKWPSAASPP